MCGKVLHHDCVALALLSLLLLSLVGQRASQDTEGGEEPCSMLTKDEGGGWVIDDSTVEAFGRDMQSLVECVPTAGVLLFSARRIKLNETLTLNRPVTIASANARHADESFEVQIACPSNQTALKIRSEGVTLSHVAFKDCNLSSSAIIDVQQKSNVTLKNVVFESNTNTGGPGCVSVTNGTVSILMSSFMDNHGVKGGAMQLVGGAQAFVFQSHFSGNRANGDDGGAIFIEGTGSLLRAKNASFVGNGATQSGAAISSWGPNVTLSFTHCLFLNNSSEENGGVLFSDLESAIDIDHSIFRGNEALEGGGALEIWGSSDLSVKGSVFAANKAGKCGGGAITLYGGKSKWVIEGGSTFSGNAARGGGAIWASSTEDPSHLMVKDVVFKGNQASTQGAGGITTDAQVFSNLSNVTFLGNSGVQGGGLHVYDRGRINMTFCSFIANQASILGGGAHFEHKDVNTRDFQDTENMVVRINYCIFENNTAGNALSATPSSAVSLLTGQGGALAIVGAGANVTLENTVLKGNTASTGGGGIFWQQGERLAASNVTVAQNQALLGGGLRVETINLVSENISLSDMRLNGNSAQRGGGISLSASGNPFETLANLDLVKLGRAAFLSKVKFSNNSATEQGGGVAIENMLLECKECVFVHNHAGSRKSRSSVKTKGGAISMGANSRVRLNDTEIKRNAAELGGGVYIEDGAIECWEVEFGQNVAEQFGGAVALEHSGSVTTNTSVLMGCKHSRVIGNKARIGGGIYLLVEKPSEALSECAKLNQQKEIADMSHQEKLDLTQTCNSFPGFYELLKERHVALQETVLSNNHAKESGPAIFTSDPGHIKICCGNVCKANEIDATPNPCTEGGQMQWGNNTVVGNVPKNAISSLFTRVELNPESVENHASGMPLEPIQITMRDSFGEVISGQKISLVVRSEVSDIISGNPVTGVQLTGGLSSLTGLTLRAQPGDYLLQFLFTQELVGAELVVANLSVTVRECGIGEIYGKNNMSCTKCDPDSFSFDPHGTCSLCPPDARCNGSTLTPNDGFWHPSSQSPVIIQCMSLDSCAFENRAEGLANASRLAHSQGTDLNWRDASYKQCAEGYSGPLCGSCQKGHGKIGVISCDKCPNKGISFFLLLLAFGVLFLVSLVFTKQALKRGACSDPSVSKKSSAVSESGNSIVLSTMEGMVIDLPSFGEASLSLRLSQQTHSSSGANRTTEVFKIMINFFQVVGTAASINVHWTRMMFEFLGVSEIMSVLTSGVGLLAFECAFESTSLPQTISSALFQLLSPLGVWLIFATLWTISKFLKSWNLAELKRRLIVGCLVVLYISYTIMTKTAVQVFHCARVELSVSQTLSLWAEDTSIQCYTDFHWILVACGGLVLVSVCIGYPVMLTWTLLVNRAKFEDPVFMGKYGFLYKAYKGDTVYWEVLALIRKGLLASVAVFSRPLGPEKQGTLALFVLFVSLLLHKQFDPYDPVNPRLNGLETGSLAISIFVFFCGSLFQQNPQFPGLHIGISCMAVFAVVGFVMVLLSELLWCSFEWVKKWWSERDSVVKKHLSNIRGSMCCVWKALNDAWLNAWVSVKSQFQINQS